MTLLIDGYNVLHMVGLLADGSKTQSLERARRALLDFVAAHVAAALREHVTVVFDAHHPPGDVSSQASYKGIRVLFARDYPDADELIEELIRRDPWPGRLTVVSSDRRLQRAAERRGGKALDSQDWYFEVARVKASAPGEAVSDRGAAGSNRQPAGEDPANDKPASGADLNPFPPGYGEDLLGGSHS